MVGYITEKLYFSSINTNSVVGILNRCCHLCITGTFVFKKHSYWTLPLDYSEMREHSPTLYSELAKSDLLIFKGKSRYSFSLYGHVSL